MHTAALDYDLPASAVAQEPVEPRDAARLLVDRGAGRDPLHRAVRDLPELVRAGDVVVVNSSRVINARLRLRKATGGAVEVLLLERAADGAWSAMVRPGRRVPPGTRLGVEPGVDVQVGAALPDGRRCVRFRGAGGEAAELAVLERRGLVPLPPYITTELADPGRYQTTYARRPGSVAAPTAGLHLTAAVLDACRAAGAAVAEVDLAVGAGTFTPIATERVEDHRMHAERYCIPPATATACERAERVVAIGTTSLRALETWARTGEAEGQTSLFVAPGDRVAAVDALLTNFHLPRSSLLALLEAFIGPRWRDLYAVALREGYRFLSFGDAMLVERHR